MIITINVFQSSTSNEKIRIMIKVEPLAIYYDVLYCVGCYQIGFDKYVNKSGVYEERDT